ncbi:TonB-dependent receptor [Tsuneonella sp. CC-YZS046]|uniref:TonB-dependent receptor n=1 Tax=Tsuneonella sp. CC-YZS046 TaxID=3042152 RepID=UPI002D7844C9|nr:TonB-dependent receptor [Tsuneonella sp. CC-YZS046]WRO66716.1 TonB-dependent receptor [Tsuneonella sp. CC-YZS046]
MKMETYNSGVFGVGLKVVLLGSAALAAAPAMAQSSSSSGGLGEIVVTATKRAENLQDVPVSISAIGSEQLASRGVTSSNDLGAVVPNLQVSSQYGETSPNFSMRGVGVTNEFAANTASPIGVYVDEVSQTFRYTHGLQLYDLDRVEVLRGPQGTLFGRNTTGGAISMYTRQPQLGEANGYLTVGYGNYDRWKLQGAVEATLVEDQVGVRVAFNRVKGDGYFKEPDAGFRANGPDSYGSSDSIGVRGNLRIKPNEDLDIKIGGYYAKDDPVGYPLHYIGLVGMDANGNGGTDIVGSTRQGGITPNGDVCCSYNEVSFDKGGKYITKSWGLSLNINYQISDNWSITSVTGYTKSDYKLNIDNDASYNDVYFIIYGSKGKDFSQDFRVNYDSDRFKGLLGVYYGKDSIRSRNEVMAYNFLPDATSVLDWAPGLSTSLNVLFGYNQKRETFAVYGEGTFDITDKLALTAGLRYTKDHVDFLDAYSAPYTDFPGTQLDLFGDPFFLFNDANIKNSYDNWSGRAILNYAWTDEIKTYVSFSRGYRSATYNGYGFIDQNAIYFVEPERLDSIEFGFKTRFANDRVQLNGALFHYDYKKQQVQEVIGGVAYLRSLDAKVKGAELELLAKPIPALTLRGSLGYLDTKYKNGQPLSMIEIGGNEIPFASKWTLSFGGDLTLGNVASGDIVFSGEVAYKSKVFYDPFNDNIRPDPTGLYGGDPDPTDGIPAGQTDLVQGKGYALVNASLAWNSNNLQVRFWGKNIFDKKYYPFGYDTAGAFGTVLLTPGQPRTYGVEATIKF